MIVLGRLDDLIIVGGRKIDLAEVAQLVGRWAAARGGEGLAVAIPDPDWGSSITAVCDVAGTLDDVHHQLRSLLPAHALPRTLVRLDPLPRLSSGKPDRLRIQQSIIASRTAGVAQ